MSTGHLVFENGVVMQGRSLGKTGQVSGRVMPYTSMTDYQSILCDPATQGQLICMTYPLIGNVGRIEVKDSQKIQAAGLILRESISQVDHWLSVESLHNWLLAQNAVAICGIDTREVIRMIRDQGPMTAVISTEPDADLAKLAETARQHQLPAADAWQPASESVAAKQLFNPNLAANQTGKKSRSGSDIHVTAIDLGLNQNLISALTARGCEVTVRTLPASPDTMTQAQSEQIKALIRQDKPQAVLLTSGPEKQIARASDPLLSLVRELADDLPVWGVDAGHLLLARSFGLPLAPLPLGHHGANYPVYEASSGRTYMTFQHHRLAVDAAALAKQTRISLTHRNINDDSVEGLSYDNRHFSTQFLPDIENHAHQTGHIWDQLIAALSEARA